MPETVWNGFLRLSLVSCPVRLAPATTDTHIIHLEQLNSRTGNPLARQFVDSRTGDVVSPDAVVRGHRRAGSDHVTLSDSELAGLASEPSNIIEVAHFAPRDQVDRARLEASYYIYPDGQLAADTLEALRLAMRRSDCDAIAFVHLGERETMVLIQRHGAGLLLSTLRPPRVLERAEFVERAESEIPAEMIDIAQAIIARRTLGTDANMLYDRYEARLRSLIDQKTGIDQKAGGPTTRPQEPAAGPAATPAPAPPPPQTPPPEPAAAAAPPPEPEAAPPPPPPPEPEPEPAAAAALEAELEAAAPAPEPELEAAAAPPAHEPEPEPAPPPPPEPEPEPEAAAQPPEPEPQPASAAVAAAPSEADVARAGAEQRLFGTPPPPPSGEPGRELGAEILLHIMGLGDRRFVEPGWAGHPGSRRQIEAISIRPREELEPSALEFRVFAQEGRATAWVSNGNYAGTRGRQLPLTGFAVRTTAELRDRFDIVYEGCFFDGGVVGPKQNGEICTSPVANDPLEAVRISIVERQGGRPA